MPGCNPGDMARVIGGPSVGALVHVDRDATEDELGWLLWPRSARWFIVTLLQPPPAFDAYTGEPWAARGVCACPDESLKPIRPDELDKADPRDMTVPTREAEHA